MEIVLASASDRRKELLERLTNSFVIHISNFNEASICFNGNSHQYVMSIAEGKVLSTASCINNNAIIIGCDTAVFVDGRVLGKPVDKKDAYKMLRNLSGRAHEVCSGIAVYNTFSRELLKDYVKTEVTFSDLSDDMIFKYIDSGEPMDKAGAYGIQGLGGVFVEKINGCYYNVVGLPLNKLNIMLRKMGVNL